MSTYRQYLQYIDHRDRRPFSLNLIFFLQFLETVLNIESNFQELKNFLLTLFYHVVVFSLFLYSFDLLHHSVFLYIS